MIWNDKISDIKAMVAAQAIYNISSNTIPDDLDLLLINQSKDWLCTYKAWRDLLTETQLTLASDRTVALPSDFGRMIKVWTDPGNTDLSVYLYSLNNNDATRSYTETCTFTAAGGHVRKLHFSDSAYLPENPRIKYSRVLADYTGTGIEYSFFPMGITLVVVKKLLQDFFGVPASQDPVWIENRLREELKMLEAYAYNNNSAIDMSLRNSAGNAISIVGYPLDGSQPRIPYHNNCTPATYCESLS